ncbi:SDR family NAD(P)-dependent oxidoreductase [Methanoregula sp.]|uniref:SDR family NAD(P)-dependent oxidoreductase n=1 Tax=Methanoregula sp. TaxID=2052170 RepID=UPI003C712F15
MNRDFPGLKGKTAIVTGASSGIGLSTAQLLAANGVRVGLVSRSRGVLEELAGTLPGSRAIPADMTKIPQVRKMVTTAMKYFGRIDILVNNAGQGYDATVEKTEIGTFRYIYDLNVVGPLVAMQQVIPVMRAQGGGTIVNISSGTALMHLPGMSPYSSSKRALAGISLAARQELQSDNITVSVVYPYITLTNFEKNTLHAVPVPEDAREPSGQFPPDTAAFVAGKIAGGIVSGEAEIFCHDWMKERKDLIGRGNPVRPPRRGPCPEEI